MSALWGKFEATAEGSRILPLECHLLDVAAIFEGLCSTRTLRQRLEVACGRPLTPPDIARFSCLAALHDLGKATPGFQNKAFGRTPVNGHIQPLAGLFAAQNFARFNSAFPYLAQWDETGGETVFALLQASFSHHGVPVELNADRAAEALWPKDPSAPAWEFMFRLGESLRQWFSDAFDPSAPPLPNAPLLPHFFAGLVMLADWLGSDTRFFPLEDARLRNAMQPEGSRRSQDWLTREVLPALRKDGMYVMGEEKVKTGEMSHHLPRKPAGYEIIIA